MSSIDRRVVEMEFDNKQFEAGVKDTLASLDALKEGLKLEGATKGLEDIEEKGRRFGLGGMAEAVENISSKFSILGAVGFTVIQNLTNSAIDFSKKIAGLVLDPLMEGGRRRAMNIEQAQFQFRGLGVDVEQAMSDALFAVQGTAFGLDEAARAASQLSASQVELGDDMRTSLRGISGVAAMTNSSYEDTARIFTRVAGQGRVMAVDLNSIASRGLNAAATLGEAFGKTEAEIREMVTRGEVSFEMFADAMDGAFGENATKANETYTGSLANLRAALARIGAAFFTPRLEQQRDLFNSLTPAIDSIGDALRPAIDALTEFTGAGTERLIEFIDGIDFSGLPAIIRPIISIVQNVFGLIANLVRPIRDAFRQIFPAKSALEVAEMLRSIQAFTRGLKMGEDTVDKVRRTFAGFFAVLGIGWEIVKAGARFFLDLFGVATEGSLGILDATASIGDFLVALHTAIKDGEGLTNFFTTLANVLRPVVQFFKDLASSFFGIFDFEAPDAEGLSKAFEPLGNVGGALERSFQRVGEVLKRVGEVLKPITDRVRDFFGELGPALVESFKTLDFDKVLDIVNTSFLGGLLLIFRRMVANMGSGVGSAINRLTGPFGQLTITLQRMQATLQAMTLMQIAIAVGILAASVLALSKVDAAGLTRALSALTVMFTQLFASMALLSRFGGVKGLFVLGGGLIVFATGIRVLVSSVRSLATMDWDELRVGLTGLAVVLGLVVATTNGLSGSAKGMIAVGTGLLVLSFGIKVLASAVGDLAGLEWSDMAKGLIGVGTLLGALVIFTRLVAVNKGGIAQGAGLVLLATGIKILASAVGDLGDMSVKELVKGLGALTGVLVAMAGFSHIIDPAGMIRSGAALILVGAAMKILASAIGDLGGLSVKELIKGLGAMAGALLVIVSTLSLMPPNTIGSALALVAVSVALGMIANAVGKLGGLSIKEIVKGLGSLAGALIIIAVGVNAMTGAVGGAAALVLVAGALAVLAPVLILLGSMSVRSIAKSLGTLAGVFAILGAAGMLLAPVVPVLLGLAGAVLLLGVGLLAAGAGVLAFAIGLTALAAAGAAGVAAIVSIAEGLIGLIPFLIETIGIALVALLQVFIDAAPVLLEAVITFMGVILTAINEKSPDIFQTFNVLVTGLLKQMVDLIPKIADAALKVMLGVLAAARENVPKIVREIAGLIVDILKEMADAVPKLARAATALMVAWLEAIAENLDDVVTAAADVIIAFIRSLAENSVRIIDEGAQAVIHFINGVAKAIDDNAEELRAAGRNLASAIVQGMTGGLTNPLSLGAVGKAAEGLGRRAYNAAAAAIGANSPATEFIKLGEWSGEGLAVGLDESSKLAERSAENLGDNTIEAMKKSINEMSKYVGQDIDANPTVSPVLDLTAFRQEAAKIGDVLSGQMIDIDSVYSKAKYASQGYRTNQTATATTAARLEAPEEPKIIYNQYNTSPKSLSSAEIYRQTKNQLSVAKGALTPSVVEED